jgi:hypothetical protein
MPYKDRKKYLEYQKKYYRKQKQSTVGSNPAGKLNPKRRALNPEVKPRDLVAEKKGVTAKSDDSRVNLSISSIPNVVNPSKTNPPSSSGIVAEPTRSHVAKLKREGWEVDDVGNAYRKVAPEDHSV